MSKLDFLNNLFSYGDGICFGDYKSTGIVEFSKDQSELFFNGNFISINPLASQVDYGYKKKNYYRQDVPRRADINVTDFRTFLFEMDSVSLDDQLHILVNCEIPFTSIVYSGGKSYHALLSSKTCLFNTGNTEDGIRSYKEAWNRLRLKIDTTAAKFNIDVKGKSVVDTSCQNPSRLTRMPFAIRENGKLQEQLFLRNSLDAIEVLKIISNCPVFKNESRYAEKIDCVVEGVEDFWRTCPKGLSNKLKYVDWADSEGMYPELLKLTYWAIDSTGIDKDTFLQVLEQRTFKRLRDAGYPEYKLNRAINDAYRDKGF